MIQLKFLEKLLGGAEVEWIDLGELCIKISSGRNKKKSIDGLYPVFGSTGIIGRTNHKVYEKHLILIARVGANAGRVNIAQGEYDVSDNTLIVENKNSNILKYLYYYLVNVNLNQYAQGAGQPLITARQLKSIKIPIPCPGNQKRSLSIQAEIVRRLDSFTKLTTELTTELNARKKQYNYYRDQLLSFKESEIEWKTLGEVADVNTGKKPNEILEKQANFDYINAGTSRSGYCIESNCAGDTVTTPSRGQGGIGYVGYQKNSFWLGPLCYKMQSKQKDILSNKFLYYFLQSNNNLLLGLKKEGGVPAVNKIDLATLQIPIVDIAKQKQIVRILDKFDTLTNSLNEGLPHEIELRQKQYEYYRNLLLSFPKPDQVGA